MSFKTPRGAVSEHLTHMPGPSGRLEQVAVYAVPVEQPVGKVRVQLFDENRGGRTVKDEANDNFVSLLWAYCARSWQRTGWSAVPLNQTVYGLDQPAAFPGGRPPWYFPTDTLACWNDAAAESPSTENRLVTDGQGLVAYANRIPVGSPVGKRGSSNVTTTNWNNNVEELIFDWPTSAGNGTFQSVGFIKIYDPSITGGMAVPGLCESLVDRRYYYYSGSIDTLTGMTAPINWGPAGLDAAGNMIIPFRRQGFSNFGVLKVDSSQVNTSFTLDGFGAAEKEVTPTLLWTSTSLPGSTNSIAPTFIGESGGVYWLACAGSNLTICSVNKTTGAILATYTTAPSSGATAKTTACLIGGNIYAMEYGGTNTTIKRFNIGTTSWDSTITPAWPGGYTAAAAGIAGTDGTNLLIHHNTMGLLRMNTSGTITEFIGYLPPTTATVVAGSSPYAANYTGQSNNFFDRLTLGRHGLVTGTIAPGSDHTKYHRLGSPGTLANNTSFPGYSPGGGLCPVNMLPIGGRMQGIMGPVNVSGSMSVLAGHADLGWNLGTRSLLGSPTTKTSSNTMKFTYTFTLPNIV